MHLYLFVMRFLFLFVLFSPVFSYSQNWVWGRSALGIYYDDETISVCTDASGNVFATGGFGSPSISFGSIVLNNTVPSAIGPNVFLAKYDANGNILWAHGAGGTTSGDDLGFSVCADINGNVIVTGSFNSSNITFGSITLNNYDTTGNTDDIFIAKYDPNGNVLWAKNAGGVSYDRGYSVSADAGGNLFVAGDAYSVISTFGTTTLVNPCAFLAKYDPNGNLIWVKDVGTAADLSTSVSIDPSGNAFLTGWFSGSTDTMGSTVLTNPGISNIFLNKYDGNGNLLWAKSATGTSNINYSFSASADTHGNVYITGWFGPTIIFGTTTLTSVGAFDLFTAKYDAYGNALWAKSAGGVYNDGGYSISADPGGNVFVTGFFASNVMSFGSVSVLPPIGNCTSPCEPMFVVKYDVNGNVLCTSVLATGGHYLNGGGGYQNCITADIYGNAYVGSSFDANPLFVGPSSLIPSAPSRDLFIAKYSCCLFNVSLSGQDSICKNSFTQLSATGSTNYFWSPASDLSCSSCQNPIASPSSTITYTVTSTANSCADTSVITITVNPLPVANITGTNALCFGNPLSLTASGGISYLWNTGSTAQTISLSPSSTSSYYVTVTDNNGCIDDTFYTVTVNPNPIASISGDISIYQGQSTILTASGGANYLWNNGETSTAISVAPNSTTEYCVIVADTNNCKDTVCVLVDVKLPCDTAGTFFFPNAFSPNGDGENDSLKIYYGNLDCIESLHLIIYDRWGEKVYETADIYFRWGGNQESNDQHSKVFAYNLYIKFTDGNEMIKKGNISLMK